MKLLKPTYIPYLIIALLGLFLYVKGCQLKKTQIELTDLKAQNEFLQGSPIQQTTNQSGEIVTQSKVIEAASEATLKKLSDSLFHLKKEEAKRIKTIEELTLMVQKVHVDSVLVPYRDSTSPDSSLIRKDSVVIPPKAFSDSNKNYQISGTVLLKGVRINSLTLSDSLSQQIVVQRPKGLVNRVFQPNQTLVQTHHTNELFDTQKLTTITLQQRPSAWQRWIKPVLGVAAGLLIGTKLL
jgi:hypothetical protein